MGRRCGKTEYGYDVGDAYVDVYRRMTMGEYIDRGYAKGGKIKEMDWNEIEKQLDGLNDTKKATGSLSPKEMMFRDALEQEYDYRKEKGYEDLTYKEIKEYEDEDFAKGGKTPKFKVRKSFMVMEQLGLMKNGTGEDMRVVYHLYNDDTGYSQNFLMKKMTNEELAEKDPSGFEVDEEVYVDFTDKDGNKKKGYMIVNSPDLAVRILRDRYGAVSIEDLTMEWEMDDKGKDYDEYTDSY